MQRLAYPFPLFLDQHGALLDAGSIYIGAANDDPESAPVTVYWDPAGTVEALQPLRTRGGVVVNNGAPAVVYIPDGDYSERVRDADGNLVSYAPSVNAVISVGASYQPLDATLTLLSGLATTAYGRSLLNAADAAALRTLAGIVAALPLTGGTVTGNILRSSAGPHIYHTDGSFVSGRIFVTAAGAADPTSQDGDIWLERAS
jgi:hypothetical protein